MKMQESGEMYLETIYILTKTLDEVHSVDIAAELGYSKPSVSRGVNLLKDNEYITVSKTGAIKFTKTGKALASKIYERHQILTDVLVRLGVRKNTAAEDACRIEHVISQESFKRIKDHIKKMPEPAKKDE